MNTPETPPELLEELAAQKDGWNEEIKGPACAIDNKECEACQ